MESETRKAQMNKGVMFSLMCKKHMTWKEGLLIKLKNMGISERIYNSVLDFLFDRKIQVRGGTC